MNITFKLRLTEDQKSRLWTVQIRSETIKIDLVTDSMQLCDPNIYDQALQITMREVIKELKLLKLNTR